MVRCRSWCSRRVWIGLSRLVPGLPGPVVLEVTCGALPRAVERVAAMAELLLKQGTGSPDYTQVVAHRAAGRPRQDPRHGDRRADVNAASE
jgi:hypothetical protein